jgi:FtsP/CotA-like multicopper oxidase with cupredoxin domain
MLRVSTTVFISLLMYSMCNLISVSAFAGPQECRYQLLDIERHGLDEFVEPPVISSSDGQLTMVLDVKYGTYDIAGCTIRHRSYNGAPVGPTLRLKPGDVLNMRIRNQLPENPDSMPSDMNVPHHFNTTNLHTHGLHVDPNGISDNVLRRMPPGGEYEVRVKIPADHPPGTFWYHPHVHGSTAMQVTAGMGGALIIEGGLDHVPEIAAAREQVLMFQQVPYDENGEIEDFEELMGVINWLEKTKRHTTINGKLVPIIRMRPGEVRRWRLIHAGVKIPVRIRLDGHRLHEIATDGMAIGHCDAWENLVLHSGYRSDVLVRAAQLAPGEERAEYWLRDDTGISQGFVEPGRDSREYLAKLVVEGEPSDMELPCEPGRLTDYVPFDTITDDEVEGTQQIAFAITLDENEEPIFTVDGKVFGEGEVRTLKYGSTDEWTVMTAPESLAPFHPFHIHVNPFQVSRPDPDGNPELVWKDTLMIERGKPQTLRMRYEDFTGRFVLHCHFLDHEDRGMMQLVEIVK